MPKNVRLTLAALLVLLCACSSQQSSQSTQPSGAPAPPLRNATNFPMYAGSSIIATRSFTQVVNANGVSEHSIFTGGNGTYTGQEVIASNGADFTQLASWVQKLASQPPAGYTVANSARSQDVAGTLERYGVSYAMFRKTDAGKKHGVLVVAMDPQRVNRRLGTVLGLIGKYKALPPMMRGPIDEQVKSRLGVSISQAMQPDSPIGATLAALDQFEHRNSRGIVIVDATRQ